MEVTSLFLVTLLGLSGLVSSEDNETRICKPPPRWAIGGAVPMLSSYGQVTVVALLQASCTFCLVQAANMGPLRDKLTSQGLTNISYIIINDQSSLSRILHHKLEGQAPPGVPVYQQLPDQEDVWEALDGSKDDFLIYDRCGRLTFHIRLPYSFLHFPFVEAAINTTYYEDYCQNCSFYANVTWNAKNEVPPKNRAEGKTEVSGKDKSTSKEDDKSGDHHRHSEDPGAGRHRHSEDNGAGGHKHSEDTGAGGHRHSEDNGAGGHRHSEDNGAGGHRHSEDPGAGGHRHSEDPGTGGHRTHHPINREEDTDNKAHRPIKTKGKAAEKSHQPTHNHGP